MRGPLSGLLPDFPWDTIAEARARAIAHPDGVCDLSIGTPVDPVPTLAVDALAAASTRWAGYPTVWGAPELRRAIIDYVTTRWSSVAVDDTQVLPVVGTKELVAWLPTQLGVTTGDTVVYPEIAYPTYEVGARLAGATPVACDDPSQMTQLKPALIWLNSPANPHGAILSTAELRAWVQAAREVGAILVSDECYGEFAWDVEPISVLHPDVNDGNTANILAAFSLSKRSNVAGYRAGFVVGCRSLVAELLEVRKHSGMMIPGPVQEAMIPLLGDHDHVAEQRQRYLRRREILQSALEHAGFRIDHSEGSLYLWATRGENCRVTVDWLAERGIVVAPGDFYGPAGAEHVRVALTASDERINAAAARLMA